MDGSNPPSGQSAVLTEFAQYLERPDVQRRNFEGKTFYHPQRVRSWISSHAERLLLDSYNWASISFTPIEETNLAGLLLVFAVLAHPDIGCAHMIHIFKYFVKEDSHLSVQHISQNYPELIESLVSVRIKLPIKFQNTGYNGVTKEFERIRWMFCPVSLALDMDISIPRGLLILPFCDTCLINSGGTARVDSFEIQEDLIDCMRLREKLKPSLHHHEKYGRCYKLAIKSYDPQYNNIHLFESNAFKGLKNLDGVVKYFGEYKMFGGADKEKTHHILLELGELDLEEYFVTVFPPVLNSEIITFWEGIFRVCQTLNTIHQLEYRQVNGMVKAFRGWHGDLKPANILCVDGQFKLADFGFAKFEEHRSGRRTTKLLGGTRTYGAPESDHRTSQAEHRPQLQTIDTWSFGCVLSAVATWLVLGPQGYHAYDKVRERAILQLHKKREVDSAIRVPTCDDAFHDGHTVLSAVIDWHKHLRGSAKRADTITHMVLDLVDKEMLISDPEKRVTSEKLCRNLDHILKDSRKDYEDALQDPQNKLTLTRESPEILRALLELDEQAPKIAQTQAQARAAASTTSTSPQANAPSLTAHSGRRGNPAKSERWDQILFGKTANRAPVLKDLRSQGENGTARHSSDQDPGNFEIRPTSQVQQPRANVPPVPAIEVPDSGALSAIHDSPMSYTPVSTPGIDVEHYMGQKPLEQRSGLSQSTACHEHHEFIGSPHMPPSGGAHELAVDGVSPVRAAGRGVQHSPDAIPTPNSELPSPSLSPGMGLPSRSTPAPHRIATGISMMPPQVVDLPEAAVYREYHLQRKIWKDHQGTFSKFVGSKPSADRQLENFIINRDIIFIVDNAKSMKEHAENVKITLLALAMKIGCLDKDGLDLFFTIGEHHNLRDVKGSNIEKRFSKSMAQEGLFMDHTNMEEALCKRFDAYLRTSLKKKQTLIVLTDGLWQGGASSKNDVEAAISKFLDTLKSRLDVFEKRWFTIQFISFGDDPTALQRLTALDDELDAAEDVVDHKPWHFDEVDKMILGSIRPSADEAAGPSLPRAPTTKAPTKPASRSATRISRFFGSSER